MVNTKIMYITLEEYLQSTEDVPIHLSSLDTGLRVGNHLKPHLRK
jgi:hypothetical protein